MSLNAIETILEENRGGVWYMPAHKEPRALQKLAKAAGFAFFHIEGKNIERTRSEEHTSELQSPTLSL
jgi:hypothetical protein